MKQVRLFSTDLDGTVVGDNAATARFRDFWQSLPDDTRPLLVLNSGRLLEDQFELMDAVPLPTPDYVIGGVGTMVSSHSEPSLQSDYSTSLGRAFDTAHIEALLSDIAGIGIQPARYQHGMKSSWYLHDASDDQIREIEDLLRDNGLNARVVYSSGRDLDILPAGADKGAALTWLCKRLDIGLDEVVVAGDTGNDRAMFELPGIRGITPANALPELKALAKDRDSIYSADQREADGIVCGLRHWLSS